MVTWPALPPLHCSSAKGEDFLLWPETSFMQGPVVPPLKKACPEESPEVSTTRVDGPASLQSTIHLSITLFSLVQHRSATLSVWCVYSTVDDFVSTTRRY
jgi:hypothetical protein